MHPYPFSYGGSNLVGAGEVTHVSPTLLKLKNSDLRKNKQCWKVLNRQNSTKLSFYGCISPSLLLIFRLENMGHFLQEKTPTTELN